MQVSNNKTGGDTMLGEIAAKYYKSDENCTSCIFKACEEVYGIGLPQDIYDMSLGLVGGLGINAMCGAIVTGVMFLSYYFKKDEVKMKQARICFLDGVNKRLCSTCCGKLKKCCKKAIYETGEALEAAIEKYR